MYREEDVECAGPGRRFVASHAVILVPPGQEVRTRWKAGRLRTVSCCFRPEMLADSPELLSFLSQIDSDHQFNIGSPFLRAGRSEEHTSELQSLMRISYAVFCLKKKRQNISTKNILRNKYQ